MPRYFELEPAWFTEALAKRFPGAVVDSIELDGLAEGTNRRARVHLGYAAGQGPATVFLKAPGPILHRAALSVLGAVNAEAELALSGAELPLEHAEFLSAVIHPRRLGSVVLLEDVTERGGLPNRPRQALSVAEVEDGIRGLAHLHARYWGRELSGGLGFVRSFQLGPLWAAASGASLFRARRKLDGLLWPKGLSVRTLEEQFRTAGQRAPGPRTLLHGDPHPGNTYALPGARTGFYDWQLVRQGHFSQDLSYFLIGSLTVADRRHHEELLVASYLAVLRELVDKPPSLAEALSCHQAAPAFGLATWLHTLSAGTFQEEEDCLAMIERFSVAYRDLDTLSAS